MDYPRIEELDLEFTAPETHAALVALRDDLAERVVAITEDVDYVRKSITPETDRKETRDWMGRANLAAASYCDRIRIIEDILDPVGAAYVRAAKDDAARAEHELREAKARANKEEHLAKAAERRLADDESRLRVTQAREAAFRARVESVEAPPGMHTSREFVFAVLDCYAAFEDGTPDSFFAKLAAQLIEHRVPTTMKKEWEEVRGRGAKTHAELIELLEKLNMPDIRRANHVRMYWENVLTARDALIAADVRDDTEEPAAKKVFSAVKTVPQWFKDEWK